MGNHNNANKILHKDKNTNEKMALPKSNDEINIKKFNKINVVGKGGFGKVIIQISNVFRSGKYSQRNIKNCMLSNKCLKPSNCNLLI